MKLTFSRQELLASMLFCSDDDSRYVINGLCLQYKPGAQPTVVSTDGKRLVVIESAAVQEDSDAGESEPRQIVLRSDFVGPICALNKALCGKLFPWITFGSKLGKTRVTVEMVGGKFWMEAESGALIETDYPNWLAVIPPKNQKRDPVSELGLNAAYLADYAKVAKLLEASSPHIQMNLVGAEKQVEVKIPSVPNFYGLIMQLRLDEGTEYQPEFLGIVESLTPPPAPEVEAEDAAA